MAIPNYRVDEVRRVMKDYVIKSLYLQGWIFAITFIIQNLFMFVSMLAYTYAQNDVDVFSYWGYSIIGYNIVMAIVGVLGIKYYANAGFKDIARNDSLFEKLMDVNDSVAI